MGRGEERDGGGERMGVGVGMGGERVNRTSMVAMNLKYSRVGWSGLYMELEMRCLFGG